MPLAWWLGGSLTLACLGRGPSAELGLVAGGPSADFGLVGGPSAAPGLAGGGGIGTGGPLYGGGGCMSGVILLKPRGSWAYCPGVSLARCCCLFHSQHVEPQHCEWAWLLNDDSPCVGPCVLVTQLWLLKTAPHTHPGEKSSTQG